MIEPHPAGDPVLEAAARYAPEAASRADSARTAPWTVAVLGRVGAGKTTLLNRWCAGDHPVGLGGVTDGVTVRERDEVRFVDTPGIDGLDRAITELGPQIAQADALLWVVDGLQPATRTERSLLDATRLAGQPLAAVISRLDLVDPAERQGIRERVGAVLGSDPPPGGDLRAWSAPPPEAVDPEPTSPRRELARQHAIRAALEALEALPPIEGRAALGRRLADRWRSTVREGVDRVVQALAEGELDLDRAVQDRLQSEARAARETFDRSLDEEPLLQTALTEGRPRLPLPELPDSRPMDVVVAAMGGEHRARARLREQGAKWMSEGLLALAEWLDRAEGIDAPRKAREADHDRLLRASAPTSP